MKPKPICARRSPAKEKGHHRLKGLTCQLLAHYLEMPAGEIFRGGARGTRVDVLPNPATLAWFPFAMRCEYGQSVKMARDWQKIQAAARRAGLNPCLVVQRPNKSPVAVVDLEDFAGMMKALRYWVRDVVHLIGEAREEIAAMGSADDHEEGTEQP